MHISKPNPEILAVLPTIDSPHFTTVTFLGKKLVQKYKRKLVVLFDGRTAPVEDEGATKRRRNLLSNFAKVGEITFKFMDSPPRAYDPPTWRSLTRDVVKG